MKIEVTKNTYQGFIWGSLNKIVAMVFPFIIRTIIIRTLGAEYSGLSSLFSSILQVLSLADLGIGTAMVYAMYKPVAEDDTEKVSALLNYYKKAFFVIGISIGVLGIVIMPFLRTLISGDIPADINIYWLYLIYLLNSVSSYLALAYYGAVLSAHQREADNSRIQLFVNIVAYSLQIISLLTLKNYYAYIVILPISTIAFNLLKFYFVRKKYPQIIPCGTISKDEKQSIRKNVEALFVYKIGSSVLNSADSIVISGVLGLVMVSNYNNYYYIINALTGFVVVFFGALTGGIGNKLLVNNQKKIVDDFLFVLNINAFGVIVSTTCLFILYNDFIELWVGGEYLFPFFTMCLFCAYYYIHSIRKTVITYRDAAGMWRDNMFQPVVSSVINLVLNIVLIKIIGINGVVISTLIAMLFIDFPWETYTLLKRKIKYSITKYFGLIAIYSFITCISCVVTYILCSHISISNLIIRMIVKLLISVLMSIFVYSLLTLPMNNNIIKLIGFIKGYFRR